MAAGYIEHNANFPLMQKIRSAVIKARESREELRIAMSAIEWGFRDGDGSDPAHYAALTSEAEIQQGGYASANAAAKKLYDEVASLKGKLAASTGVGDETGVAIDKLAGFLGI